MREYGQVRVQFWSSPTVQSLDDSETLLATYLIAGPHTTAAGVFRCPDGYIQADLGWDRKKTQRVKESLQKCGLATFCFDGWVVIPKFLQHNPTRNVNQAKNIERLFDQIPANSEAKPLAAKAIATSWEAVPNEFANRLELVCKQVRTSSEPVPKQFANIGSGSGSGAGSELGAGSETGSGEGTGEGAGTELCSSNSLRESDSGVRTVFDHYRTHHPRAHRKPNSKSKEWKLIKARLAEGFSSEELCLAVDGCHKSAWHMGENERQRKYDSLELIVRDGSHVQQFIELYEQSKTGQVHLTEKERRGKQAAAAWVERKRVPA